VGKLFEVFWSTGRLEFSEILELFPSIELLSVKEDLASDSFAGLYPLVAAEISAGSDGPQPTIGIHNGKASKWHTAQANWLCGGREWLRSKSRDMVGLSHNSWD